MSVIVRRVLEFINKKEKIKRKPADLLLTMTDCTRIER